MKKNMNNQSIDNELNEELNSYSDKPVVAPKTETFAEKEIRIITEKKAHLRFMRDKDRQKVRGIFQYYEIPGGNMSFVFKAYKEDPVETYNFVDGETYEIPLGVAKHLNKNGWYPVHQHAVDANGNPIMRIGSKTRRFGFQSLEFTDDIEDLMINDKKIITVEYNR